MTSFPPTMLQHQLLLMLGCVVGTEKAVYVSGPITTGPRFVQWYRDVGHRLEPNSASYHDTLKRHVRSANERDIVRVAAGERERARGVVIDPTALDIPSWEQRDFHVFWIEVIGRFCGSMIVLDGWQYSVGAAIEFAHAVKVGVRVYSLHSELLGLEDGRSLILEAASEIRAGPNRHELLDKMAEKLRASARF